MFRSNRLNPRNGFQFEMQSLYVIVSTATFALVAICRHIRTSCDMLSWYYVDMASKKEYTEVCILPNTKREILSPEIYAEFSAQCHLNIFLICLLSHTQEGAQLLR